ncbi:MAG: hypothetical protein HXY37_13735 [Chloroflexi bacterium]|nr:hypothetical protein [Chloroflexota bacterium]
MTALLVIAIAAVLALGLGVTLQKVEQAPARLYIEPTTRLIRRRRR